MGLKINYIRHWNYLVSLIQIIIIKYLVPSPRNTSDPSGILIIKTDRIGDMLVCLDLIYSIQESEHFKSLPHSILTSNVNSKLLDISKFKQIVNFDLAEFNTSYRYKLKLLKSLHTYKYIIVPTHSRSFSNDLLVFLLNGEKKISSKGDMGNQRRLYKLLGDKFYDLLIDCGDQFTAEILKHAEFLKNLGFKDYQPTFASLDYISEQVDGLPEKYYIISPGASNRGRQWPTKSFATLVSKIYESYGISPVIVGTSDEEYLGKQIIVQTTVKCFNFIGRLSLTALVETIRGAKFYIGNESGGVHMANSLKIKSFAILGGGHFGKFLPHPDKMVGISTVTSIYKEMRCFKCNWNCIYDATDNDYPCINEITVDQVYFELNKYLDGV